MIPENDPALRSFIEVAPDSHFPIQNLPFGVFRCGGGAPHVGVAIGTYIVDLAELAAAGMFDGGPLPADFFVHQQTLNGLMAAGPDAWRGAGARQPAAAARPAGATR